MTRVRPERDNHRMGTFLWPSEDGWPYPDAGPELTDPSGDPDEDLLSLHARCPHLFDGLDDLEHRVVFRRYGLDGQPPRSMKELGTELGLSRTELREVLGSGLQKLRTNFAG